MGDPNPTSLRGKGDVALFGAAMVTLIPDTFCTFKTPRQKTQQEAMNKYTD